MTESESLSKLRDTILPQLLSGEILLNTLVHRNYMGSMTQLKVMDDRLSLWNAGALPMELTIEKLFQVHESFPRNPLIADVCYKAGYIDSWGRGVEKIVKECEQAGLPAPVFEERSGGVAVELVKAEVSEGLGNQLGNTKERILAEMKDNPKVSGAQLADALEMSKTAVEKNIKQLREDGLIKRIGGTRGHWEVVRSDEI